MDVDYFDEAFEADAPKYVNFGDLKQCHDLEDNADDWFNYDHENGGIPITYSSPEKMDVASPEPEYHDSVPAPVSSAKSLLHSSEEDDDDLLVPPAPLTKADLMSDDTATDSPAMPLQKPPPAVDRSGPATPLQKPPPAVDNSVQAIPPQKPQNNLELIRVSGEGTPKDTSKTVPKRQVTAVKTSCSKLTPRNRRATRSISGTPSTTTQTPSQTQNRRSAGARIATSKTAPIATKAPPPSNGLVRSNSLRRSARPVGKSTPVRSRSVGKSPPVRSRSVDKSTPGRARSLDRRSANTASAMKRSPSVDSALNAKRKRRSSPAPSSRKSPRLQPKPKLTMPRTPACLKRNMNNLNKPGPKSSLDMEMDKIRQKRIDAEKMKKLSMKSHKQAASATNYHPARSKQEPTRPVEFKFETDSRIKDHSTEGREDREKDFVGALRKHPQSPTKPRGPTIPNPFHFSDNGRKRHHNDAVDSAGVKRKFKPMALQVNDFHKKTPERFRTRAAKDVAKGPNPLKAVHIKQALTCPKTPALETKTRKRQVTVVSAAEKEELEVQEMRRYNFRARPVNPAVMSNLNIGVKRPQHKEPTVPVGFNLESERRVQEREANKKPEEEEEAYEFHARPLNPRMLEGPIGIAPAKPIPVTCPESPAFALKNRVRVTRSNTPQMSDESTTRIIRANPLPHTGIPFLPTLPNHGATKPEPFSFDHRDRQKLEMKEAKISMIIEEDKQKASQFKAQPILSFDHPRLPGKKTKPVTKPEPFISVEERGARQAEQWGKKVEEELNEQRRQANSFKAKPADVIYEAPFVPAKSTKPLTDVSDFELNTDRRAVDRQGFEERKHAREAEVRVANDELKRQEEEDERQAIERLRLEMVHRPNPIRNFKQMQVLPSQRPLTEPQTPHFETDARLRNQPRL